MKSIHDYKLEAIGNGPDHDIREVSGSEKYKQCTVWSSWFRDSSNKSCCSGWVGTKEMRYP